MDRGWQILLATLIGIISIYYLYRNFFNYFKRNGVIHVPPVPIFGNMLPIVLHRISSADFFVKLYNSFPDAKYFGFHFMMTPMFLLRDPEIIKSILIKNFKSFPNRRSFSPSDTLFSKNLFSLQGQKWRDTRTLLSPSFTSSKMKMMFTLMSECAVDFSEFLSNLPTSKTDMDMKDALTKFTNDVIATCAFGIKIDSMKDPTNRFYLYGKEVTKFFRAARLLKFLFFRSFPRLASMLRLKLLDEDISSFFYETIQGTIEMRDRENIRRSDMLQLMMDIRGKEGRRELDVDDMTAQAFIFFLGGFETTSSAMSYLTYHIATNPHVQKRIRAEIDQVLKDSNGDVTYETINQLEYLNAMINESLRLHPPVIFLERVSDETYELPPALPGEKAFVTKKGTVFWVSTFALHRDAKYFDEPDEFRPERFLDDTHYNAPYYVPFGLGPRMCIANRFALLELKVLMFHLLARCELKPCAKTTIPLRYAKDGLIIVPEGGFWLNVQRRTDTHPTLKPKLINGTVDNRESQNL